MSRILLVDDDRDLVEVLVQLFCEAGPHFCVAAHSLAEVEAQREPVLSCDLAFIDVNLGYGQPSGLEIHRWLMAQGFHGRIYFFTGHAQDHPLVMAAARTPNTQIIAKPIDASVLMEAAEAHP
jgi:FixJ family two-component response regulator